MSASDVSSWISPSVGRKWILAGSITLASTAYFTVNADAHDGGNTPPLGIVHTSDIFSPIGSDDHAFNGFKVYLSSPRHSDSGSRGECTNPGRQENVNGRYWNWEAANGTIYGGSQQPENPQRNIHGRGYKAMVSENSKDNGYIANRNESRNWGSDLHIVTHTNATGGCDSNANYLLTMWESDSNARDDKDLALALGNELNSDVPGAYNNVHETGLAELETNAPKGDAYVELQFHDNQSTQTWIYNHTNDTAYHYGLAIDAYLNYP